jgi:hypothetical protein
MTCAFVLAWMALLLLVGEATAQRNAAAPATGCVGVDFDDDDEHAQAAPREATCLRELRKTANRKGDLLTLRLENGASKIYRNNPKACDDDHAHCVLYSLVGYHPAAHLYSILIQYYEGGRCDLVSARTGKAMSLSSAPHFSPDGSTFIVIDNDLAYGGPHDIAVGSTASDPPSLVWQHPREPKPVEWHLQHWIDNDRAALRAVPVFPADAREKCQREACEAILVRFATSWTIRWLPVKPD